MPSATHIVCIGLLLLSGAAASSQAQVDRETGLTVAPDWTLVRANCIACHSARLITQQRGTASQWLATIRWMQETQNLWPLEPDIEARIVDYLAENYPPSDRRRRSPIPRHLMPEMSAPTD